MPDQAADETCPTSEPTLRAIAMPADTNTHGDIFGGWLLCQMDLAGSVFAYKTTHARPVTVAIEAMTFRKPVYVGDLVSVYGTEVRIGRTSITVHIEAWVQRRSETGIILVTDGNFTYVSIDQQGNPKEILRRDPPLAV